MLARPDSRYGALVFALGAVLVIGDEAGQRPALERAIMPKQLTMVADTEQARVWLASHPPPMVAIAGRGASLRDLRGSLAPATTLWKLAPADLDDDAVAALFDEGAEDIVSTPIRPAELARRLSALRFIRSTDKLHRRRQHDAELVLELTRALASTLEVRGVLVTVVERVAEALHVDRCSIVLTSESSKTGYVVVASDDPGLRDLPIELRRYPEIQEVLRTGEPLAIADAARHPLLDPVRLRLPNNPFRSMLLVPIAYEASPVGVLFLRSHEPGDVEHGDMVFARIMANTIAIALRNARVFESLRHQSQEFSFARVEAERRMKALQRYADFFHSTADGILVIEPTGAIVFSNLRAREILGLSEADLADRRLSDIFAPRRRIDTILEGLGRSVYPTSVDVHLVQGSSEGARTRIVSVGFNSVLHEEAVIVSFREVTAERATEAELTKTKDFLQRVIDSSVDAIISADMSGNVLLFNRAAVRCYGYAAETVLANVNVRDLYPPGKASAIMRLIHGKEHGGPGRLEGYRTEALASDGTRIPVLLSAALIFEEGKPIGSVGVFKDMRHQLRMEAELAHAEEALQAREKQAIVAELAGAAAHELNQPLTSILGYAELIRRRVPDGSPLTTASETIVQEAERMAELVRKIGRMTRYVTKHYVGAAQIIDLNASSPHEADEVKP